MGRILDGLKGKHVDLISVNGSSEMHDRGVVMDVDDQALMLEKDNHQILVFPLGNIRLIKRLDEH